MALLAGVGWALLVLLGLVLVLLALVLFTRLSFEVRVHLAAECPVDAQPDLESFLSALEPATEFSAGPGVRLDYRAGGYIRLLGGLFYADRHGARLLGRRVNGRASNRPAKRRSRGPSRRSGRRRSRRTTRVRPGDLGRLWPLAWQAFSRSWKALQLDLVVEVSCGLEDPASTGMLAAWVPAAIESLVRQLNARSPGSVSCRFTPVFDREILEVECRLRGRPRPAEVIWPWLRFALRRQVRQLWWPRVRRRTILEGGGCIWTSGTPWLH